jgi:hypothetical protein
MSDEEYEYEYGSEEDYQYGSGEDEEPKDDLIAIENAFYEGDDCRQDDPKKALEVRSCTCVADLRHVQHNQHITHNTFFHQHVHN